RFAEQLSIGEPLRELVALEVIVPLTLEIETGLLRQPQQTPDFVERHLIVLQQRQCDLVAVFLRQLFCRLSGFVDLKVAHLLPDAKPLCERVCPGAAVALGVFLIGCGRRRERTLADRWLLQRTLIENKMCKFRARVWAHRWMMRSLHIPDSVELVQQQIAGRIEVIFRLRTGRTVSGTHGIAALMPPPQKLSERACLFVLHPLLESGRRLFDRALVVI